MPQIIMDWWVILVGIATMLSAYFAWHQIRKPKPAVDQTMTNSRGSTQTAKGDDVKQVMDNVTDGNQDA